MSIYLLNHFLKADDYNCDYPENINKQHIVHSCGIFSIKYTLVDHIPNNTFGLNCWKDSTESLISFYSKDELAFTKEFKGPNTCIVIHGDGLTKEGTFFTFYNNYKVEIYNMNNNCLKEIYIGGDFPVDFKRVNDKYAIGKGEEGCTYAEFTALFELDILFGLRETTKKRPYNDSRVHFPICSIEHKNRLNFIPMFCKHDGMIVEKNINGAVITEQFSYDDIFEGKIDFHNKENRINIADLLTQEQNKKFEEIMCSENPTLFILPKNN